MFKVQELSRGNRAKWLDAETSNPRYGCGRFTTREEASEYAARLFGKTRIVEVAS